MYREKRKILGSYLIAVMSCITAIFIDQITKYLAVGYLKNKDSIMIIPNVFQLHYLENRGAAFGILQNHQIVFVIGAIAITLCIIYFYTMIPLEKKFIPLRICAILTISGAIGNLIDRIHNNYVIDFFYFSLIDFPVFNVADCYVVIAMILFSYLIFFVYKDDDFVWLKKKKG